MANGQRRENLPGFGASALGGFTTQLAEALKQRREQQSRVSELLLGSRLKREEQALDPEFQAKQEALRAIQELTPLPSVGTSSQASPEARSRLQELFQERMQKRLEKRANLSEMFGLTPKRQPTTAETMAEWQLLQNPPVLPAPESLPSVTSTERLLIPTKVVPGQALAETGIRAIGRNIRVRETARSLTRSYQAKTATAARAFGDSANIAIKEREFMQQSFPQDSDTYEGRLVLEKSVLDFFDSKEQDLSNLASQPVPQTLAGFSRAGARYVADPAITAQRKGALEDLRKLRQARIQYTQMFEEANRDLPPIGAIPRRQAEQGQERQPATNARTGQLIQRGGQQWRVVGRDTDGELLVEPAQ